MSPLSERGVNGGALDLRMCCSHTQKAADTRKGVLFPYKDLISFFIVCSRAQLVQGDCCLGD